MTSAHVKVLCVLALLVILAWVIGSRAQRGDVLNRLTGRVMIALSLVALLDVVGGFFGGHFFTEPKGDESGAAHVFQLAVIGVALTGVLFLSSAKWSKGPRAVRPLAVPAVLLALAFGTLFCLEHFR